jgi:hypothetical protein
MTAEMSVQITLALANVITFFFLLYPSAGTGRQDNLKIY